MEKALRSRMDQFIIFNLNSNILRRVKFFTVIATVIFLTACGGASEDLELAPERPFGSISGFMHDGSVKDGNISAYTFAPLESREFLGNSAINEDGEFEINIQAPSQVVLLEATTSAYTESSSNIIVNTEGKARLTVLVDYTSGETHITSVTPLTHMVTGLAFYNQSINKSPEDAYIDAYDEFKGLFDLPLNKTRPVNEDTFSDDLPDTEEEVLYGLLLAGLSELTKEISKNSEPNLHETINTWYLSELLFNDLATDGLLNGVWNVLSKPSNISIVFGSTPLQGSLLQKDLAAALLNSELYLLAKNQIDFEILENFIINLSSKGSEALGIPASDPLNKPKIDLAHSLSNFYAGDLQVTATVSDILKLKDIKFYIDENLVENNTNDVMSSGVIDTTQYSDGSHTLTLLVIDEFGNEGLANYEILFDNSSPTFTVTSPNMTNLQNYRLTGTYSEGGSGIKEILVDQENVMIDTENNWFIDLELSEGSNKPTIKLIDELGNEEIGSFDIVLDTLAPQINMGADQGEATFFITNNKYFTGKLIDHINSPIYLPTNKLSLNGEPISSDTLKENALPFFTYTAKDLLSGSHATPFSRLDIKVRVKNNDIVIRDWFQVDAIDELFYIPITREIIGDLIDDIQMTDNVTIEFRAIDEAGNESSEDITFKLALHTPNQNITIVSDTINQSWLEKNFQNRSQLYNQELDTLSYDYINTSNYPVFINLSEPKSHKVVQSYEELKRENQVRLKTLPFWRVGKVDNPRKTCPEFDGNWQAVDRVFNYTEGGVWVEQKPQSTVSDPIAINQDILPVKSDSDWMGLPDFDNLFETIEIRAENGDVLSYQHDYVVDTSISGMSQPTLITQWQSYTASDDSTRICDEMRNLQFMEKYEYIQEPGYPRNVVTEHQVEESFSTSQFRVFDEDQSEIHAIDGWYKVPAAHKISIIKYVLTPPLVTYNDDDVANPDSITEYAAQKLDRDVTWLISQSLTIDFAHDLENRFDDEIISKQVNLSSDITSFSLRRQ